MKLHNRAENEQARILHLAVAGYVNADGESVLTLQQTPADDALNDVWECRRSDDYF